MNNIFYYLLPLQAIIYFVIYYSMQETNKEEWKYTTINQGVRIALMLGFFIGALIGSIFGIAGVIMGSSLSAIISVIAIIIVIKWKIKDSDKD